MRFAYADPPYLHCAAKHYADHPAHQVYDTVAGHKHLIARLMRDFPDGWAYSLASTTITDLAPLMPQGARWGAWTKPFCSFKPNVNPAYAWEPVVFFGGRKRGRDLPTVRDWCAVNITLKKGLTGAKPEGFTRWILDVLGVQPADEFVDLFPGSGMVTATVEQWRAEKWLAASCPQVVAL